MPFDAYILDEVTGIRIDWETPVEVTDALLLDAGLSRTQFDQDWKIGRLLEEFSRKNVASRAVYRRGAVVFHDDQEVFLIQIP